MVEEGEVVEVEVDAEEEREVLAAAWCLGCGGDSS